MGREQVRDESRDLVAVVAGTCDGALDLVEHELAQPLSRAQSTGALAIRHGGGRFSGPSAASSPLFPVGPPRGPNGPPMTPILTLLVVLTLSIVVTRVATVALAHTGLSMEMARFQARSAFTGCGYTTNESENVMSHPVRRRIVMLLMLLGNAGFVTAASSLVLTFLAFGGGEGSWSKAVWLVAGLAALWVLARSSWIDHRMRRVISRAPERYGQLDVRDYGGLLHLSGDYRVVELAVEPEDWLADRTLEELKLRAEGALVLGIERENGAYVGAPKGPTRVEPGDRLIVYGRVGVLDEIDRRRKGWLGDREHEEACAEQRQVVEEERRQDPVPAR